MKQRYLVPLFHFEGAGKLAETQEAIREAFMRLYARERMERITVKGLCAEVPVARTTFYAHYRNIDDVLVEVEDGLLAGLAEVTQRVSGGNLQDMNFGDFLDATFAFIRANWNDIRTLLVVQPDIRFINRWKAAVKANFARRYPEVCMQPHWELLAEIAASATIGAYTWWMEHPDTTGIDEIKRIIEQALSAVMSSL